MKALRAQAIGRGAARVGLHDVDPPEVADDDVKIKVAAVSASQLDLSLLRGKIPGVTVPRTLGIDPVGTIVDAGRNVPRTRLGATVVVKPNIVCHRCRYCRAEREADCLQQHILGVHADGGAAEFVVVPSWSAFDVPSGVDVIDACATVHTFPVAGHMLRAAAHDPADLTGKTVLITGVTGAVGSAVAQLARRAGATVIGGLRGTSRSDFVRSLGAAHLVDIADESATHTLRSCAPDGVDIAIDATGNISVAAWVFEMLGWTGQMITCAGGPQPLEVPLGRLYRKRQSIRGVAGSDANDVVDSLRMVQQSLVKPVIDRVVDIVDYESAYHLMERGGHRHGRVVMRVAL